MYITKFPRVGLVLLQNLLRFALYSLHECFMALIIHPTKLASKASLELFLTCKDAQHPCHPRELHTNTLTPDPPSL